MEPTRIGSDDLLQRYLQAVGQYLPEATRQDTLAELRANLLEAMDARAEELGRPLHEAEAADILRAHGRPRTVALRYLPQRSLIGPALFPFYVFTLRRALPLVALVALIAGFANLISAHSRDALAAGIVSAVFGIVPVLLIFWAVVTITFAVIEAVQAEQGLCLKPAQWDPLKLPAVKVQVFAGKQRSLISRVADLVAHCLWMAYVLAIPSHPFLLIGPGTFYLEKLGIAFAPVWKDFYLFLVVLLVLQLVMKLLALAPGEPAWKPAMELVTNLLGAFAVGLMACAREYFVPLTAAANLDKLASVNHAMGLAFRITLIAPVVGLCVEIWKLLKRRVPVERLLF